MLFECIFISHEIFLEILTLELRCGKRGSVFPSILQRLVRFLAVHGDHIHAQNQ